jgi:DNA-binding transcriptional ArsR family regulator
VERVQKEKAVADDYSNLANLYKCFADSTRVQILHALEISELCVCDIAAILEMTKSAISHQLKMLREANLVTTRRVGKIVFYSLADDHVKQILDMGFDHVNEKE